MNFQILIKAMSLPAVATGLALSATTALATPAEEIAAFLDGREAAEILDYETIVNTRDGGVRINNITVNAGGLDMIGLQPFLGNSDNQTTPTPEERAAIILRIDSVHLNDGMFAVIFGVRDLGQPDSAMVEIEGLTIDLTAAPDAHYVELLRGYLGGANAIEADIHVSAFEGSMQWHDIHAEVDLADIGSLTADIQFQESGDSLPRATVTLVDMPGRPLLGLITYLHRAPVEMVAVLAEQMAAEIEAELASGPEESSEVMAVLQADAAAARADLARFPDDSAGTAAALAGWAQAFAAALPAHASFFDAVDRFAQSPGSLRIMLEPQAGTELPQEAALELSFYDNAAAFGAMLDAFGATAEFTAPGE